MLPMKVIIVLLSLLYLCESVSYENSAVFRIRVNDKEEFEKLRNVEGLNLWNDVFVPNGTVTGNVDEKHKAAAVRSLKASNVNFEVLTENLESLIRQERLRNARTRSGGPFNFETYHTLNEINRFIDSVVQRYPNKAKSVSMASKTYENRDIKGIIIRENISQNKSVVFFECGIHAREWASPATCIWIINELTSKPSSLLQKFDFHIFPVVNPDGYSYTWTGDRLWRKNRSPNDNGCVGTDLNRNFDFDFCRIGCSTDPCKEIYCGRKGFSEKETQAIRDYVLGLQNSLKVYISLHAFSQLWMYPWSYTDTLPGNDKQLKQLSIIGASTLKQQHNTHYYVGNIATTIYSVSSSSLDWVYANTPCKLVFILELRDTGRYGFLLPPNQIKPMAVETWAGLHAMLNNVQ